MSGTHNSSETADSGPFADKALEDFVRELADQPPMSSVGRPAELRRQTALRSAQRPDGPAMATTDAIAAHMDVRMRLYQPNTDTSSVIVFFHGGGWTIGDLDSYDRVCRRLADRSGCPVLAVEYRLAPEHPAPAAVDDAVSALRWIASGPDELGQRPLAGRGGR